MPFRSRTPSLQSPAGFLGALRACVRRYWIQECAATVAALGSHALLSLCVEDRIVLSLACAATELVVFYAVAFARQPHEQSRVRGPPMASRLRSLLEEYGPAEVLDLGIRPVCIALGLQFAAWAPLGILAGTIAADACFYLNAATRHHFRDPAQVRKKFPAQS